MHTFQILREFASQREQILILFLHFSDRFEGDQMSVNHTLSLAATGIAAAAGMSAGHRQHQHTIATVGR